MSNGVPVTTLTSLANLFDVNPCGSLTQGAAWDGTDAVINIATNSVSSCTTPANVANLITFNYSAGTSVFGLGMGNFQSPGSAIPITNHELFVNGTDQGEIENLAVIKPYARAGTECIHGDYRHGGYKRSRRWESRTSRDRIVLILDHLAVATATSSVPEPATGSLVLAGLFAIPFARRRLLRRSFRTT